MYFLHYSKTVLVSIVILFFVSCGDSTSSLENNQTATLKLVEDFSNSKTETLPTVEDYRLLGLTNMTGEDLDEFNELVLELPEDQIETVEDLKVLFEFFLDEPPVAFDQSVSYVVGEDAQVKVPLKAYDPDGDELVYTITQQPEHGTVTIEDGVLVYIPHGDVEGYDFDTSEEFFDDEEDYEGYYNGEEFFDDEEEFFASKSSQRKLTRFFNLRDAWKKAKDVVKVTVSNAANKGLTFAGRGIKNIIADASGATAKRKKREISIKLAARKHALDKERSISLAANHLVWFNGTSEELVDNQHLFAHIREEQLTRVRGWGIRPFWANYVFYSSAAVGIENKREILNRIDSHIKKRIEETNKKHLYNAPTLVVGGFSRGAAFFVPYFLDRLDQFLPNLSAKTTDGKQKTLIIYLMDPVHGSKDETEKTIKTLRAQKIYDKTRLIKKLKDKGFKLKLIFMPCGFDMRQKSFKVDKTFYEQKDQFDYYYSAKIGLTHANMSTWTKKGAKIGDSSKQPKQVTEGENILNSLKYGSALNVNAYRLLHKKLIKNNADLAAMNELNQSFTEVDNVVKALNKIKPDNDITRELLTSLMHGTYRTSTEKTINDYHDITEKYLGTNASNRHQGLYYTPSLLFIFTDTDVNLNSHSRLGITRHGTLSGLIKDNTK